MTERRRECEVDRKSFVDTDKLKMRGQNQKEQIVTFGLLDSVLC